MERKYIKQIIVGILITVGGGVILAFLTGEIFRSDDEVITTSENDKANQNSSNTINFRYELSGRSFILGTSDKGVWASAHGDKNPLYWYLIEVYIENNCEETLLINPNKFKLYVNSEPTLEAAETFSPSNTAVEFQKNRFKKTWLEPGQKISGTTYFKVPTKYSEGMADTKLYNIIRYVASSNCVLEYDPAY